MLPCWPPRTVHIPTTNTNAKIAWNRLRPERPTQPLWLQKPILSLYFVFSSVVTTINCWRICGVMPDKQVLVIKGILLSKAYASQGHRLMPPHTHIRYTHTYTHARNTHVHVHVCTHGCMWIHTFTCRKTSSYTYTKGISVAMWLTEGHPFH